MKQLTVGDLEALEASQATVDKPVILPPSPGDSIKLDYEALPAAPVLTPAIESAPKQAKKKTNPKSKTRTASPKNALEAMITHASCTIDGGDMRIEGTIKNSSQSTIILDSIRLLGKRKKLGRVLQPAREESFLIYEGRQPENADKTQCELTYTDARSTRYVSKHLVAFQRLASGMCKIKDVQYTPPPVVKA